MYWTNGSLALSLRSCATRGLVSRTNGEGVLGKVDVDFLLGWYLVSSRPPSAGVLKTDVRFQEDIYDGAAR